MNNSFRTITLRLPVLLLAVLCTTFASPVQALNTVSNIDVVRERGQSVPPFLNPGVKANLLLLIDNSGSMLDMAYTDEDTDGAGSDTANSCFDGTFSSAQSYTGYFEENSWYKWDSSGTTSWQPSTTYSHGALVYDNGILYQAVCAGGAGSTCDSGTSALLDDTSVTWNAVTNDSGFTAWQPSTSYANGALVYDHNIIYKVECSTGPNTATTCSAGASSLADDNSTVTTIWRTEASGLTGWQASASYANGDFVYEDGTAYMAECAGSAPSCTSGGTSLLDDNATGTINWQAISNWQASTTYADGSYAYYAANNTLYQAECTQGPNTAANCTSGSTPLADNAVTAITWHTQTDGNFVVVTDGSQCTNADYSNANVCIRTDEASTPKGVTTFAATGKFLNWLSASKFDIEKKILTGGKYNTDAELLISEHRGCAGTGFLKEVSVSNATDTQTLSFRVRGPISDNDLDYKNDQITSADNTTRIEILGITDQSIFNEDCKDAVDGILAGDNLNSLSNKINNCLTPLRVAEDDALADQRPMLNHALQFCQKYFDPESNDRNLNAAINECEKLYQDYPPSEINPYYGAYACYGIYDSTLAHTERSGYIGRCWNPGTAAAGTCNPKPATADCTIAAGGTTCTYTVGTNLYRNHRSTTSTPTYNYLCTNIKNNSNPLECQNEGSWDLLYTDGTTTYDEPTCGSSSGSGSTGGWVPANPDANPTFDDPTNCVQQGMQDYCGSLSIPEVIDPSDQASTTSEFWNTPATLIESGIVVALGTDRPLAVMKGHIKQSSTPSGVLQRKAQELRIGAMKLNAVGADYECAEASGDTSAIEKFCPEQNADGARLIAPLKLGKSIDADGKEHIANVAEAINDVKADTWTPLAEAVYSALGYFTQRADLCLNKDNSGNCLDFPISADDDPVQQSCQPNHLLIITEGASTADIDNEVAAFATAHYDGTGGDTTAALGTCTDGLQGSTFLDDLAGFGYYYKPTRQEFSTDADFESAYDAAEIEAVEFYTAGKAYVDGDIKESVVTHIITSGSLRDEGTGECNPATLMTNTAQQGGSTGYVSGENPADFESGLNFIFESILSRASAGSAASVISSSRSGEGAVYQAIFWPELAREDSAGNKMTISWAGEVHSLFIDSSGFLYEDTNGDGKMRPIKDLDGDGVRDTQNEDTDGDNWLDVDEDATTGDVDCDGKVDEAEDKDGDGNLDVVEKGWTTGNEGDDKRVIIYFDSKFNKSMGCYKFQYTPVNGDTCNRALTCGDPTVEPNPYRVPLEEIKYIWSANDQLAKISGDSDLLNNRSDMANAAVAGYISASPRRNIFTWNDLNSNGIVDSGEILDFVPTIDWDMSVSAGRGSIAKDFGLMSDSEVDSLVSWMRGKENPGVFRERQIPATDGSSTIQTWRLGDVIHSTPMVVGAPQEGFHLIYNDGSYATFAAKYDKRRNVVYYGANDGMLHAVNGGFYSDDNKMFCRTQACVLDASTSVETNIATTPELGAELWAYVPYNLQPHLEFLANPDYVHKYYVDLRPRIFDAQIFPVDGDHPGGWGTILVGGMRFGGAPVHAQELNGLATDNRVFASSYFVFDITNPEKPPRLLGEVTRTSEDVNFDKALSGNEDDDGDATIDGQGTDMGYSTSISTMVIMKEGGTNVNTNTNRWYLMLGSGPHSYYTATDPTGSRALKGFSDQNAKVAVLPLQRLFDSSAPIRIPDTSPTAAAGGGRYVLTGSSRGFVSDLITVDFDIAPSSDDYMADAVYFGTVEANSDDASGGFTFAADGSAQWNGGGKLYRLRTRNLAASSTLLDSYSYFVQKTQRPFFTASTQDLTLPEEWEPTILMDPGRPITGAPSVAYDSKNFFVYFGTGRFFDADDKADETQQAYYGIKEPLEETTLVDGTDTFDIFKFTWETVELTGTSTALPGSKGLLQVDEILVHEATSGYTAALSCRDNTTGLDSGDTDCLPANIVSAADTAFFDSVNGPSLLKYIAGTGACTSADNYANCVDGWYKPFYEYTNRERNLGQATILGGLVTFTTYQPFSEPCLAEGISYLYGVYYQTGTSWYENVFGQNGLDYFGNVRDKLVLGRGLSTTPNIHVGGDEEGVKAFIQTSTGEIKEVDQENLPLKNYKTGMDSWKEYEKP